MTTLGVRNGNDQLSTFHPCHPNTWVVVPCTLGDNIPSGDRCVALGFNPKITLCYEPDERSYDDDIRDLEHDLQQDQGRGAGFSSQTERYIGLPDQIVHESPPLYSIIRRVFHSDPSLARILIDEINRLPSRERDFLVAQDNECVDGSSSTPSKADEGPCKKRRTTSKSTNKGTKDDRLNGNSDGRDGDGDNDKERDGDGNSLTTTTRRREKKNAGWVCPYPLVYPRMRSISRFNPCFSANMIEKNQWRSHLITHHSPEVHGWECNSDMPADYYMSGDTYEAVMGVFNKYLKRPRDNQERTNQLEALFNEVWCIIFPKDKFPGLQKPRSPFHNADSEYDNMSEALTVILLKSRAADGATEWLSRSTSDTLETAGASYMNNTVSKSLTEHDEEVAVNVAADMVPPTPTTMPPMPQPQPASVGPNTSQRVQLFASGTLLQLMPIPDRLDNRTEIAYLDLPATYYIQTMRPLPSPRPTMNKGPIPNPNPADLIQGVPVAPDEVLWSLEEANFENQGFFMPAMEGEQMIDGQFSTTLD
ncbi:hypothetical protein FGSG_07736 [Fusarium graminearum PH-1]|uniref:Chromosome 4, complete genome n=1 Tax=Gibberella zeae (strain ATCC MYA-4620 / CBS 123657 / FGSC 9075 / NRRL 31084 / PH-1) TaxID=229533 RepID=I1RU54_GIBZE|nr:hypothetical protein FGSG_07736 [Fusarium graminearum PH-1]ESU14038.1 hypothetical protein FGSG_07736 [Fusarium graminearum PH-1]CAF3526323.1 unnamed protein product [Fusarium graminearum]SCB65305.1 unnamed protein product [Fusarium graminearum]|eukprot:XP_011327545.1 hypothetical protein FGSG_07736 [Fusarium graminearum PH-1]